MLTTTITAVIAAILTFMGVEPGPYLAGVWVVVFIVKAALILGVAALMKYVFQSKEPVPVPVPVSNQDISS